MIDMTPIHEAMSEGNLRLVPISVVDPCRECGKTTEEHGKRLFIVIEQNHRSERVAREMLCLECTAKYLLSKRNNELLSNAAPDLLAACKGSLELLEATLPSYYLKDMSIAAAEKAFNSNPLLNRLRAAITKATGGQHE